MTARKFIAIFMGVCCTMNLIWIEFMAIKALNYVFVFYNEMKEAIRWTAMICPVK